MIVLLEKYYEFNHISSRERYCQSSKGRRHHAFTAVLMRTPTLRGYLISSFFSKRDFRGREKHVQGFLPSSDV